MKTIWKYSFKNFGKRTVLVPEGAKALKVGAQNEEAVIWFEVETDAPLINRNIYVAATGRQLDVALLEHPERVYLGTAICDRQQVVWHLYETPIKKPVKEYLVSIRVEEQDLVNHSKMYRASLVIRGDQPFSDLTYWLSNHEEGNIIDFEVTEETLSCNEPEQN